MKRNLSLQKKSASRIAAVQCIFRALHENLWDANRLIAEHSELLLKSPELDPEEPTDLPAPDMPLLNKIVAGVCMMRASVDALIDPLLSTDWKRERMDPLLIALLQCAIFELKHLGTKPQVAVDEYVTLAGGFFGPAEQGFVNSSLQKILS